MKVSIVTVCMNSERTIGSTLASVNAQEHEDIEHIVIDGGSRDGTVGLVKSMGTRLTHVVSEKDHGIYHAMNKGLAIARGDIVGFLNSDDVFSGPKTTGAIAAAFGGVVDACYGDVVFVKSSDPSRIVRHWRAGGYRRGMCASGWAPPHPTLYIRRGIFERLGSFNERMRVAADFDLALRLFDVAGIGVRYIPEVLVRMRAGGASNGSLKGVLRGHREMAESLRAQGLPVGWGWSMRRLANRIPQLLSQPRGP